MERDQTRHKVQISKDVATFVKKILVAEREGRFSEIKDEDAMIKMLDKLTVDVTEKEVLEWSNKTRSDK